MEYAQMHPAETNINRASEQIENGARQMARYADRRVQENPWTAVAVGFGVGVLFGTLTTLLALKG